MNVNFHRETFKTLAGQSTDWLQITLKRIGALEKQDKFPLVQEKPWGNKKEEGNRQRKTWKSIFYPNLCTLSKCASLYLLLPVAGFGKVRLIVISVYTF